MNKIPSFLDLIYAVHSISKKKPYIAVYVLMSEHTDAVSTALKQTESI